MKPYLNFLRTVAFWVFVWGAFILAAASIVGVLRPQDIDPGETKPVFLLYGSLAGAIAGAIYGLLKLVIGAEPAQGAKARARDALLGALAATPWPLVSPADDRMLYILCPLGALTALALEALSRPRGAARVNVA